jgi:hypothetical protein
MGPKRPRPVSDWQAAVRLIDEQLASPTDAQVALAKASELDLAAGVPNVLAAAVLADHLHVALRQPPPREPPEASLQYLELLAQDLGEDAPKAQTKAQVEAWIYVLQLRRSRRALTALEVKAGDIVARTDESDVIGEVSSISANGRVNFSGGYGGGAFPHQLRVIARAAETSAEANDARRSACNQAQIRRTAEAPPSGPDIVDLETFQVEGRPSDADVAALLETLDNADDERPVQALLESTPVLLAGVVSSTYGTFVIPKVSLGGRLFPDFLIGAADSMGFRWTLVEIESPRERISLESRRRRFAAKADEAIAQIKEWRAWIEDNIAFARQRRADNGLGLVGIRPASPGLVLIGRRRLLGADDRQLRQQLRTDDDIAMHTYDWLVDAYGVREGHHALLAPLEWPEGLIGA